MTKFDTLHSKRRLKIFFAGAYKGKVYSGQYGDMAATVAAILLEPEARSVMLDYDPTFGRLREPLLKVMCSMHLRADPVSRVWDFVAESSLVGIVPNGPVLCMLVHMSTGVM